MSKIINIRKLQKLKREVDNLYKHDRNIIGSINDDKYIQVLPVLKIYHKNKDNKICAFSLDYNKNMKEKIICPKCKEDILEFK